MNKHTRVSIKIEPVGEKSYTIQHLLKNTQMLNKLDVDDLFVYGNKYNDIIEMHKEISKYKMLDNWSIDNTEIVSDSDLGIEWAFNMIEKKAERRKGIDITFETDNFWLDPKCKQYHVTWHTAFASDYFNNRDMHKVRKKIVDDNWGWYMHDVLESLGWIRFQGNLKNKTIYHRKEISPSQWRVIIAYCTKYNLSIDKTLYREV